MGYVDRIITGYKPPAKSILLERIIINEIPVIEQDEEA
jgi:hypothetical protein